MPISSEAKQEVERFIRSGQKIEAIKYLCDTFQVSLADGKLLVESVEAEMHSATTAASPSFTTPATLAGDTKMEVQRLLRDRKKLEAVKYVRLQTQAGLKEALEMVEEVEREINPNAKPLSVGGGCLKSGVNGIAILFAAVALLLFIMAGIVYYRDAQIINQSAKINGRVVELLSRKGTYAPVIAYTLNGKDYRYESTAYTKPSAYEIDEVVPMFVNPNNHEELVLDTFTDRWLAISIVGGIGLFFTFFAVIFRISSRRF